MPEPSPPLPDLQLVFSDEFEDDGRSLAVEAGDKRWTAERMWYAGTEDMEVYVPDQVGPALARVGRGCSLPPCGLAWGTQPRRAGHGGLHTRPGERPNCT